MSKIFHLADRFKIKLAQPSMESLTPDQVAPILDTAKLWGGHPFDVNGRVADVIFGAMSKAQFQGRFDANLVIDPKYNVKIIVNSDNPKTTQLQSIMQNYFGQKMSQALKQSKIAPPAGDLTVGWLSGIQNVAN